MAQTALWCGLWRVRATSRRLAPGAVLGARLEQDERRDRRPASGADELDGAMKVGVARGDTFGDRERVAGLEENVQAPPFDLPALGLVLERVGAHGGGGSVMVVASSIAGAIPVGCQTAR